MIDTINFKLNNVSKYPLTRTKFEATTKTGQTVVHIDEDTGEYSENTKIRAILHHDSDTLIPLSKRSALFIPSSNYSLSYLYNITQDCISFEFSIPKYLYGTNIIQFVKYFNQDCDTVYDALVDFVFGFFRKHTFEVIDMIDVELTRLDLCYNQFFNSKYEAMTYLNLQKELLRKFCRNSKNDFRTYDTSLLYVTKRYSFKIYHKGTEFRKNDARELGKKNPTGHQITELQEISDKILRYEITFRKAQIDYLFEQNDLHEKYLKFFKTERSRQGMRSMNRPFYDKCLQFCEQSKHFVFIPMKTVDAVELQTVSFDRTVFACMYNFFWDYVKKYQLTQKLSISEAMQKIDSLNEKKENIPKTARTRAIRERASYNKPMLTVLMLLTQYETLANIRKSGLLSRSTFFNYQKKLKALGVTDETLLTTMPPPTLDYLEYKAYFGHHHAR